MNDVVKMAAFLFAVCAIAASALALTDMVTRERIEANKKKVEEDARRHVLGGVAFENSTERTLRLDGRDVTACDYFDKAGHRVAVVLKAQGKGFGGAVVFMAGIDPAGRLLGVKVIEHGETPGLGTNVVADKWLAQFKGLGRDEAALSKDDPRGKVDALTGVTVTSRAVSSGVRNLLEKLGDEFKE